MSKVITFSTVFPSYHPKAGQPTNFVEKIWWGLNDAQTDRFEMELFKNDLLLKSFESFPPKFHTIRAGKRWKVGDKFSPRIWSGRPYHSKQITIAEDLEVKAVWDIEIYCFLEFKICTAMPIDIDILARNDGFDKVADFMYWFKPEKFVGQIISWSDEVKY